MVTVIQMNCRRGLPQLPNSVLFVHSKPIRDCRTCAVIRQVLPNSDVRGQHTSGFRLDDQKRRFAVRNDLNLGIPELRLGCLLYVAHWDPGVFFLDSIAARAMPKMKENKNESTWQTISKLARELY